MINNKEAVSRKKRSIYIVAALLAFLLVLSLTLTDLPAAYADNGAVTGTPAETVAPTEEPQPSETPIASEEPLPAETVTLTTEYNGLQCVDGEILVKFKDTVSDTFIANALEAEDSSVQQELPMDNIVVTDVPKGETVESFIETMEAQPGVEYAQPNYIYHVDKTVNDPLGTYQWHLGKIGAMDAWDITMGSPSIKVAIIDTGMDLDHPDLAGKVYAQYDYVNGDSKAQDDNGHGTHVAGIIAATANNGKGVAGVAPGVKLIIVKALNSKGYGSTKSCVYAIDYAVRHGANVINMSYGGYGVDTLQKQEIDYATSKGVVCVAAAGNGDENDRHDQYSSPSDFESCISVTATGRYDTIASWSDYSQYKDISAPGVSIYSTYNPSVSDSDGDYYGYMSGTSMASPVVAGTAALVLSVNPDLTVDQVKEILYSTAVDLGDAGKDDYYGYGRVNAKAAVDMAKAGTPVITSAVSTNYHSIDLSWNAMDNAAGYEVWRSTSATAGYAKIAPQTAGTLYTDTLFADTGLNAGTTYYYKVKVYYQSGIDIIPGYFSVYSSVRPVPLAPASITVQRTAYSTIKAEWSAVEGATGYMVYRSVYPDKNFTKAATTSGTYAYVSGLYTGTPYYFKVCAYRSSTSIYGAYSPVSDPATPTLDEMTGVAAATYYPTAIKISWKAVPGATGYRVYRSDTLDGTYGYIGYTTYTYYKNNTGLAVDKQYYYKVRAYRTVNGVKIFNNYSEAARDTTRVFQVKGVKAVMYSVTSNKITWSSVTGATGYVVTRYDAEGNVILTLPATSYTYCYDKNLAPNKAYYYKVQAYRTVSSVRHYGLESDIASATPLFNNVTNVKAAMYSVTSNKITWNSVSGRTGYEVWWCETKDGEYTQLTDQNKVYSYTYIYHRNLEGNCKPYYYKVVAYVTVNGERQYSAMSDAVTAYNKMSGIKGVMYSVNSNKISWSSVPGSYRYEIWRSDSPETEPAYWKETAYTYYYDKNIDKTNTYYYKVRAYILGSGGEHIYCELSDTVSVVNMVTGAKAYSYSYSSNKITWNSVANRTNYEVWSCDADGNNLTEKPLKVTGYTYYINTGLTTGQTYYYKVRAYQMIGGVPVYSNYSDVAPAVPTLKSVSGARAYRYSSSKIKLTWYSASGATGYEVLRWNGVEYVPIKTTTLRYYYDSGLTHGTRYYYRIRAYRTVGENKYYGGWSNKVYATP